MIGRRDLLLGAGCFAAAGAAYQLKPHHKVTLLNGKKMEKVVPTAFGTWTAQNDENLVKPQTEGKLAARLYSEIVQRVYQDTQSGAEIMMLIAYGDTQSDLLQLHRPESCYPAVGYKLLMSKPSTVPLNASAAIPSRRVVAEKSEAVENIVYWTRLGEFLPTGAGEQRKARFETAVAGIVPDGGLFRFSVVNPDSQASFALIDPFIEQLVAAVAPADRRALLTTGLAAKLA